MAMKFQQGTGSCFWGSGGSIRGRWHLLPNFPDPLKPGACSLCQLPSWPRPRRQIWVLDRIQDRIPRLARERGRGPKATSLASQLQLGASVIGGHRAPGPKQRYRPLPGLGQLRTQAV